MWKNLFINHYTPESLEESKQWVKPCESALNRPKMQQSAGKVMANVLITLQASQSDWDKKIGCIGTFFLAHRGLFYVHRVHFF